MSYVKARPSCVWDTECFMNYWSVGFECIATGRRRVFELFDGNPLDKEGIATIMRKWRLVGFHSRNYDVPMLLMAMSGATNAELKRASDNLIQNPNYQQKPWVFLKDYGLREPNFLDSIDLNQVTPAAPGKPSLKLMGGRLHSKKIQEMPVEIDEWIIDASREVIRGYHGNDLTTTKELAVDLKSQLDLRCVMSDEYGLDLRSKSDAQIAEAVIRSEMEKATGREFKAPAGLDYAALRYETPDFISFKTPEMQRVLQIVQDAQFKIDHNGKIKDPESIKLLSLKIGQMTYKMGIGGLHSTEKAVSYYACPEYIIRDRDVTSYYPRIIEKLKLYPSQLGPQFLNIYSRIIRRRIEAKLKKDKNTAETLKIVLNGSFGKFGSPFSILYDPKLLLQTTITGQLALLMQIERLEMIGCSVISANTDGVVTKIPRHLIGEYLQIYREWETITGFETEETEYKQLHSRDVNNYLAIKWDLSVKQKGTFSKAGAGTDGAAGHKKNPEAYAAVEAVIEYLRYGTPIEETLNWWTSMDFRNFLSVRRVNGGALQYDEPVGKVVRWYYAKGGRPGMFYKTTGNAVPITLGAKPCLELPDDITRVPDDLDMDWYVAEAYALLQDIGVRSRDPRLDKHRRPFYARLEKQKTFHLVLPENGASACGRERESIREPWIESEGRPMGRSCCKKCQEKEDKLFGFIEEEEIS